jgi:hypothetical protein
MSPIMGMDTAMVEMRKSENTKEQEEIEGNNMTHADRNMQHRKETSIKKLETTGCPKKIATPIFRYISVRVNATVICLTWAVVGCPPVRFAYRHRSER